MPSYVKLYQDMLARMTGKNEQIDDLTYRCEKYRKFLSETGQTQTFIRWKMKEIGIDPQIVDEAFDAPAEEEKQAL